MRDKMALSNLQIRQQRNVNHAPRWRDKNVRDVFKQHYCAGSEEVRLRDRMNNCKDDESILTSLQNACVIKKLFKFNALHSKTSGILKFFEYILPQAVWRQYNATGFLFFPG